MTQPPPNKALGQHYLHDPAILQRIAIASGAEPGAKLLEIGPGPGALTRVLLENGAHVSVLELDERMRNPLIELQTTFPQHLTLHFGDALQTDLTTLAPRGIKLCGNLPYNVGTEIVFRAIQSPHFAQLTFLLQKEVVLRICAQPGAPDYGRLAVWCDLLTQRQRLFDVAPGAFHPPPKVTSSVVQLAPRPQPLYPVSVPKLKHVLDSAFNQRRKMLRSSLKFLDWQQTDIDPTRRPETLTTAEFCALANLA